MQFQWWMIGVCLSLTASLFGTLGKVMMKLSHINGDSIPLLLGASFCVVILNPTFDAMSYAYAAQSILAPMAGFSIVWNIILSPFILGEQLQKQDILGTILILLGCVFVSISGSHQSPNHTQDQLYGLFQEKLFTVYISTVSILGLLLFGLIIYLPRNNLWRRFAFGSLSGLVGGNLFFLKATVELISVGKSIWQFKETYIILSGALVTAGGGVWILNLGLKDYDALYLVSVYQSFLIVVGSVSGIVFFHETLGMHEFWQEIVYAISICFTLLGIVVLSLKDSEDNSRSNGIHLLLNRDTRIEYETMKYYKATR